MTRFQKSWSWKLSKIENEKVTENVADLLVTKIKKFTNKYAEDIALCQLIRINFFVNIIADALNTDLINIELTLWHATQKKIILAKQSADGNVIYHFLHDKIQQSCINNESFNELEAHHSIGQALLKKYSKNAPAEQLNKITHHLNKSAVMLTHNEIEELIDLNQRYGDQLINNLSDASAQYYYSTAISLYHKHGITNKKN